MKMHLTKVIDELNHRMVTEYVAVDATKNPIFRALNSLQAGSLQFLLQQYSLFSKNICTFLLDAYFVMAHEGWGELADELAQNVQEELGREPGSNPGLLPRKVKRIPHYVLLRRGLKEGLGIDVGSVSPSVATTEFILGIREVMNDLNAAYVAGGTYALESSAVPELRMVYRYARKLFSMMQKPVPRPVAIFFESHIEDLEIGHELRLKSSCDAYINSEATVKNFKSGFLNVMGVMDRWWEGLNEEIIQNHQRAA
jgi:uncharacterized protein DUF3865